MREMESNTGLLDDEIVTRVQFMNQQTDMLSGKRQSYPCRMTGNEAENSSGKIQMRREMINEDPYSKGLPHKGFS